MFRNESIISNSDELEHNYNINLFVKEPNLDIVSAVAVDPSSCKDTDPYNWIKVSRGKGEFWTRIDVTAPFNRRLK